MKKIIYFIYGIVTILVISCSDDFESVNCQEIDLYNLPKYPMKTILLEAHNYIPGLSGVKQYDNIEMTRGIYKDSLWENRFGKTLFAKSDETVLLPNNLKYVYPGALLKGNSIEEMRLVPLYANVKPITVSVSFPTISGGMSKTIQPTLSGMRAFINEALIDKVGTQISSSTFSIEEFTSYNELRTAFGSNVKTGALFWKNKQEAYEESFKISKRTGLYIKYIQRNFTIDMDQPQDGALIEGVITGEDYSPIYINSVTFGQMGILAIETDSLSEYAYSKFNEISKKLFVNKKEELTTEERAILNEATMKLYLIAPGGSDEVYSIDNADQLFSLLNMNRNFTKESPGVPIYCSYAYLSDNSAVEVKYQYSITSDPLYVKLSSQNNPASYGDWPNTSNINIYRDVIFSFYRDTQCKIPAIPPYYIKFNISVKSSRVQYKWNAPNEAWGSVTKDPVVTSFVQNNFRETEMVAYQKFAERIGIWSETEDPFTGDFFARIKKANVDCKASFLILDNGEFYQQLPPDDSYTKSRDYTNGDRYLNEMVCRNHYNWGNMPTL